MNHLLITTISILLFHSCTSDNSQGGCNDKLEPIASITETSNELKPSIANQSTKDAEPGIITQSYDGGVCKILVYTPNKLKFNLTNKRPENTPNNYLSVAAAFTDKDLKSTTGKLIIDGETIFKNNNPKLSGGCIIGNNSIKIIDKTNNIDSLSKAVFNNHESYFQQALIVYNNKGIVWNLPNGDLKVKRRALIEFNNQFSICESASSLDIKKFQEALIDIGVKNAIYLDMGSWSEGWYKSVDAKQIKIGDNFSSTHLQTNWIYLSEK